MVNLFIYSLIISIIIYLLYNFLTSNFIYIWITIFAILLYFFNDKIKENFSSRVPKCSLKKKKLINCKKNNTCNISENNYNLLPKSIINLGKKTAPYYKTNR